MTPKEIEQHRDELMVELRQLERIFGLAGSAAQQERDARIVEVRAELLGLPQPAAMYGEAFGIVQIGGFLGDPWRPGPKELSPMDEAHLADPFYRYAIESGQAPE